MSRLAPPGRLIRSLGRWGLAAFVVNGMVGAGIFALPASVAEHAGAFAPLLVLGVGIVLLPVVLVFTRLARLFDRTGGPIAYVDEAFGRTAAFQIGWLQCLSTAAASAANVNLLADYATRGLSATSHAIVLTAALLAIVAVNLTRNTRSSRTIGVVTVAKLLPLVLLAAAAVPAVTHAGSAWPPADWSPAKAVLLAAYALVGFEGALTVAGEARDPRRDFPRVLLGVFAAVVLLYALLTWGYVATSFDPARSDATPLATMGGRLFGSTGLVLVTAAAMLSIFGNVLTTTFGLSRRVLVLEELGTLPHALGRIEPASGLPRNAVLFVWLVLALLAVTGGFTMLALISVASRLLVYLGSLAAWPVIARRRRLGFRAGEAVLLAGAVAVCLALIVQSEPAAWLALLIASLGGFAVLLMVRHLAR